jgi:ATP-dependent Lon protease
VSNKEDLLIPDELPLIPLRDMVIFPSMIVPLFVARERSVKAIDDSLTHNRMIFLASQRNAETEEPGTDDIYRVGTVALIVRMLKIPDGRIKILIQGVSKGRIDGFSQTDPFFRVRITRLDETLHEEGSLENEALMRAVKEQLQKMATMGKNISPDMLLIAENLDEPGRLADLIASNITLKLEEAQAILEMDESRTRLQRLSEILAREINLLEMQQRIVTSTQGEIDKNQREYYLREQLKAIQKELGEMDGKTEEMDTYRTRIEAADMPPEAAKASATQLGRLERMHPDAAEAAVIRTYLDWLVELPWKKATPDALDIVGAEKVLNEDHFDLEKVKTRILEYLAVRKLKEKMKGPILCFVGPPGVGKTSLGRSIARALGRKFVRISLGGVRDEAEIRGHRRTYVGALPGKIISGIHEAGTNNPVFMLDEIDKLGADFRGDPSSALLEVLDPEQNYSFTDHYLGVPFDLSKVMFIATANLLDPVPSALKDRMEVIDIPGYTDEDKLHIARRYLVPRQLGEHGLTVKHLRITDRALLRIISDYTREAGLRNMEREIAAICRKVARKVVGGERRLREIGVGNLVEHLGVPRFSREGDVSQSDIGVATGLAWTPVGGELLHIEATVMKGKGHLSLTGSLGEVMKESAQAAVSYARTRTAELGIGDDFFYNHDIHIHVPAGAIPKDGPSAGITITTAIISALTGRPVSRDVAMTGEVTLRGRVLPIGGLKEKALAAHRAGIRTVIIPERNKLDITEIPPALAKKMNFVTVSHVDQVLAAALIPPRGKRAARAKTAKKKKPAPGKTAPAGKRASGKTATGTKPVRAKTATAKKPTLGKTAPAGKRASGKTATAKKPTLEKTGTGRPVGRKTRAAGKTAPSKQAPAGKPGQKKTAAPRRLL